MVMLVVSTDLQAPKDFDELSVDVEGQTRLFAFEGTMTQGDCGNPDDDVKEMRLPVTIGLESRRSDTARVTVTACRKGKRVLTRTVTVDELPSAGDQRVPMLRMPIDWRCTEEEGVKCGPTTVKASQLPSYDAGKVFGGASGPGSNGACFDTLQAFQNAPALETRDSVCTLASVPRGSSLGLVRPPATMGICGRATCFVPIDAELVESWRDPSNLLQVDLPNPFCRQLSRGGALAVVTPRAYPVKTESLPTCGAWSSVTSRPGWVEDPLPAADALLAAWNMNEEPTSKRWIDGSYRGCDITLHNVEYTTTRVGGRGYAARFDGKSYAMLAETKSLRTNAFTLSVWVSFGPDDMAACEAGTTWPVVSTRPAGEACVGYELGIRCSKPGEPEVAFGYGCKQGKPQEIVRSLPRNSGKWTAGDWYHVAAVYAYDETNGGRATLILDGSDRSPGAEGVALNDAQVLYVGTNDEGAASGAGKLQGYLDDLLVFGRALEPNEISDLYSRSATVDGPGGFRWGTWDATGSVTNLNDDSTEDALRVHVEDAACSSGGAVAHVGSGVLSDAETVTLTANIPKGVWLEFGMSGPHGVPQCTWYREGQGAQDEVYEFDLRQPGWCTDSNCGIERSSMQTVTVSTHWKRAGSPDFGITGLKFSKSATDWAWGGVQAKYGNAEVCWRPVTYEPSPQASASWADGGWDEPKWPVVIAGNPTEVDGQTGSTAEAAGFIMGGTLDLTECTSIGIELDKKPASGGLEITIEDADGMSCQATLDTNPVGLQSRDWSCYDCAGPGAEAFAAVRAATTRVAVRKPWQGPLDPFALEVKAIRFGPPNCERVIEQTR